jgi:hypothetical protein
VIFKKALVDHYMVHQYLSPAANELNFINSIN